MVSEVYGFKNRPEQNTSIWEMPQSGALPFGQISLALDCRTDNSENAGIITLQRIKSSHAATLFYCRNKEHCSCDSDVEAKVSLFAARDLVNQSVPSKQTLKGSA